MERAIAIILCIFGALCLIGALILPEEPTRVEDNEIQLIEPEDLK